MKRESILVIFVQKVSRIPRALEIMREKDEAVKSRYVKKMVFFHI